MMSMCCVCVQKLRRRRHNLQLHIMGCMTTIGDEGLRINECYGEEAFELQHLHYLLLRLKKSKHE